MLYTPIGGTPAAWNGSTAAAMAIMFSLYASGYFAGWNTGASKIDSGACSSAWQSQSMMKTLRIGSPRSATAVFNRIASGQVMITARTRYSAQVLSEAKDPLRVGAGGPSLALRTCIATATAPASPKS